MAPSASGLGCCEVARPGRPARNSARDAELSSRNGEVQVAQEKREREEAQRLADLYVLLAVQQGEWSKSGDLRSVLERRGADREMCQAAARAAELIVAHESGLDALVETGCVSSLAKAWQAHSGAVGLAVPVQAVAARFWERACCDHDWYLRESCRSTALAMLATQRPEWLMEMHRLAVEMHRLGHRGAADAYKLAIEHLGREYGPSSRVVLQAQNNLAVLLEESGLWLEAEKLYDLVLATCKVDPALGQCHADALSCKFNLAALKAKQGNFKEAEGVYREVLKARELSLGPEDADVLRTKSNLAGVLQRQGTKEKLQEAETFLQDVTDERQKLYGKLDPRVLKSRCAWALVIGQQACWQPSKLVTAEQMLKIVVDERRSNEKLGPAHPETLAAMSHLAMIQWENQALYHQGPNVARSKDRGTEQLHEEIWTLMDARVPDESRRLKQSLQLEGALDLEPEAGRRMLEQVVERRRRHLSPEHPDVLAARSELATLLSRAGHALEAREEREAIAEGYERALGKLHVDTLAARMAIPQSLLQEAYATRHADARDALRLQAQCRHAETVACFAEAMRPCAAMPLKKYELAAHAKKNDDSTAMSKYAVLRRD